MMKKRIFKWLCSLFKEDIAGTFYQGFEAGQRAGRDERSAEIAKQLLAKGWDAPEVALITLLEVEEVDMIQAKNQLGKQ